LQKFGRQLKYARVILFCFETIGVKNGEIMGQCFFGSSSYHTLYFGEGFVRSVLSGWGGPGKVQGRFVKNSV
jgi:hypothetical protein